MLAELHIVNYADIPVPIVQRQSPTSNPEHDREWIIELLSFNGNVL